jgi:putative membrane protein
MWIGLGVMFVLFGVSAAVGVFYRGPASATSSPATYPYDFPWWGFIGLFFAFFWIVPWIFGAGWWGGRGGYRYRRWYRYDDAYQILRERYAKGEVTKEQFEQMMRDLQHHE